MSSFFSKPIRNIIGSKASEAITENTFDKWIAPEHKDTLETAATTLALMAATGGMAGMGGAIGNLGSTISGALGNMGDVGNILQSLGKLGGKLGDVIKTPFGIALMSILGAGGNASGFLDKLGLTGGTKDMAEYLALLATVSLISDKYAESAEEALNAIEQSETTNLNNLIATANKYSDPEYQEQMIQAHNESISQAYQGARESSQRSLAQRGLGERMPGAEAYLRGSEAEARLKGRRDTETGLQNQAFSAQTQLMPIIQNQVARKQQAYETKAAVPFNFLQSVLNYDAQNKAQNAQNALIQAQIAQIQNQMGGGSTSTASLLPAIAGLTTGTTKTAGATTPAIGSLSSYTPSSGATAINTATIPSTWNLSNLLKQQQQQTPKGFYL